MTFNKIVVLL